MPIFSDMKAIENGEIYVNFITYKCSFCCKSLPENYPMVKLLDDVLCPDCSFINGIISEDECKDLEYFSFPKNRFHLQIINEKVILKAGKRKNLKQKTRRSSIEYQEWRISVFERDNYTCRKCGKKGGNLNAHHIKPYKKFPELRLSVDNGITYCQDPCHKEEHFKTE